MFNPSLLVVAVFALSANAHAASLDKPPAPLSTIELLQKRSCDSDLPGFTRIVNADHVPEGKKIAFKAYRALRKGEKIGLVSAHLGRVGTLLEMWTNNCDKYERYIWRSETQIIDVEMKNGLMLNADYEDSEPTSEDMKDGGL